MQEDNIMEEAINNCINYSRKLIRQIDHAKGVEDGLEDIKTLVFAAMVSYYGIEHLDDVYLAFLKTDFVKCSSISGMLEEKYNFSKDLSLTASSECPGTFYDATALKKINTDNYKIKRRIYVSDEESVDILVRNIAFQINRVINSVHNPILKKRGAFGSRMGISFEYFDSRRSESVALENAINRLQINELMSELQVFGLYHIEDEAVRKICDQLFNSDFHFEGDDLLEEIIMPLYQDKFFNSVLVDKRLKGDLVGIKNSFDFNSVPGGYSKFLTACEKLSKGNLSEEDEQLYKEEAKMLVKSVLKRSDSSISGGQ